MVFTLYGIEWQDPEEYYDADTTTVGADVAIKLLLGKKKYLLFSATVSNHTRDGCKTQIMLFRSIPAPPRRRFALADAKIQMTDSGCTWSFDPPKLIYGNALAGFIEDTTIGDLLRIRFLIAVEKD